MEAYQNNKPVPPVRIGRVKATWHRHDEVHFMGKPVPERSLRVTENEDGYVLGDIVRADLQGQRWRIFRRARGVKWEDLGWVLESNLLIRGVVGTLKIVRTESLTVAQTSNMTQRGDTCIERTVRLLFSEIESNRLLLLNQGLPGFTLNFLKRKRDELVNIFLRSVPSEILCIIENGNSTFKHLYELPNNPAYTLHRYSPDKVVIYAILFLDIDRKMGIYIGKTIHAGQRIMQHTKCLLDPNAPGGMYRVGRQARERTFIKLLELDGDYKQASTILQVFEHTFVCLFRSWVDTLLRDPNSLEQAEKFFSDSMAATIFSGITDRVCATTGWKPLCLVDRGLNWKTPLFDSHVQRALWTAREIVPSNETGPIRIHTTQPRKVVKTAQPDYHVVDVMKGKGLDQLCWKGAPYPGTMVNIIAEIYIGEGKRHPIPFARLPEPGPFSDWGDINRIGIRIEWTDDNGFHSEWRQATRIWSMKTFPKEKVDKFTPGEAKAYPHLFQLYLQLIRFYNTLRGVVYDRKAGEVFSWLKCGHPIVIKELIYDHFEQKVLIQDQPRMMRDPPTLVSFEDNMLELDDRYSKHSPDGALCFGDDNPRYGRSDQDKLEKVRSCDVCYEPTHLYGRSGQNCPSLPAVPEGHPTEEERDASCVRCFALRRCCTHTRIKELFETEGLQYLREIPKINSGPQTLDLPFWCQDMGPTNDGVEEDNLDEVAAEDMEEGDDVDEDAAEAIEV